MCAQVLLLALVGCYKRPCPLRFLYYFVLLQLRTRIMDHRANLENLASPRHTYTKATMEEGPSTPEKMVSGLSTCCDKDEEMWMVPVQEKGPHLPEELAMTRLT